MTDTSKYKYSELTERIIGHPYEVHKRLGFGFLKNVYKIALIKRLLDAGISVREELPVQAHFEGEVVGEFFYTDIFVDDIIIIELKSVEQLISVHEVQLVNYLKATGIFVWNY